MLSSRLSRAIKRYSDDASICITLASRPFLRVIQLSVVISWTGTDGLLHCLWWPPRCPSQTLPLSSVVSTIGRQQEYYIGTANYISCY